MLRKDHVCIDIIDQGIGIPKDKVDIIFERFGQVDSTLSRQAEGETKTTELLNNRLVQTTTIEFSDICFLP